MAPRIGFLGAGLIAHLHAFGLHQTSQPSSFAGVFDPDADRAAEFAAGWGATVCATEDEVLDSCDAVYICTWTSEHARLLAAACGRGLPVFCEKPLAFDAPAAAAMADVVDAAGVVNQVGLVLRHSPAFAYLRHLVGDPEAGRVMSVVFRDDQYIPVQGMYASTWRGDKARAGAGTLLEHSIHDVDILEWILGPIASVSGRSANFHGIDGIEDSVGTVFDLVSGGLGVHTTVWHDVVERPSLRRVEVLCERRKRESHDIAHGIGYHERWGPDEVPPDVGVPVGSTAAGFFAHQGRDFCLEICRDQRVGDALDGCLLGGVGPPTGALIQLFTSNGTTVTDGFLPVRDQGLVLFCDGGAGNQRFLRVTRVNPVNNAPNVLPFTNYRVGFTAERNLMASAYSHMDEVDLIDRAPSPDLQAFLVKYNALYGAPSSDAVLQGNIDLAVGAVLPAPAGVRQASWTKGLRIQEIVAGHQIPTGVAIPLAEEAAATNYALHLVGAGVDLTAATATGPATTLLHNAATAQFGVAVANAHGGTTAVANAAADLTLYNLVDL